MNRKKCWLPYVPLFVLLAFAAFSAERAIYLQRMPGDRLDVSMANELTHAALEAQEWLIRNQNDDGSWGAGTNVLYETALVLFTLNTFNQPESAAARERGKLFLKKQTLPCPGFPFGLDIHQQPAKLAQDWPPPAETSARFWAAAAFSINRAGGTLNTPDGTVFDWRRDAAQRLIDTQRKSLDGGSYWKAAPKATATDTEETAFALLAFFEL
ncbi:MAG: hypothetical protein J5985_00790 [Kiritimatiellae bacterium]|nr:hypothetical protein [Kiritimatiellia bacterium]